VPNSDVARRNPFFKGLVSQSESMMIVIDLDQSVPAFQSADTEWTIDVDGKPSN
jgi:hypothetical protein